MQSPTTDASVVPKVDVQDEGLDYPAPGGSSEYEISDALLGLCTSPDSVSSLVAADPILSAGDAWKRLYATESKASAEKAGARGDAAAGTIPQPSGPTQSLTGNERARACGKWGPTQPSELFLTIFRGALRSVDEDVTSAVVSPSLLGSCGTAPLTIISTIPDICRHMSNLIVRAEKEVFLATNFWKYGIATTFITNALRELSRRAGHSHRKVVVKLMYDRGSAKQLVTPHYYVPPRELTGKDVRIPLAEEVPHLDLQVVNYHKVVLGTFHSKFMVIDRKIAIVQSNNIQDNDNVEMMVQLEGPIVDSLYDTALISWHARFDPPLPSHNVPASIGGLGGSSDDTTDLAHRGTSSNPEPHRLDHHVPQPGLVDAQAPHIYQSSPTKVNEVPEPAASASTILGGLAEQERPRPLELRQGPNQEKFTSPSDPASDPSVPAAFNQTQDANDKYQSQLSTSLAEHTTENPNYDDDIAGEAARVQTSVSPGARPGETRVQAVTRHLNHTVNEGVKGDAPECDAGQEMTPYILHTTQRPFPVALVNRPPCGSVGNRSLRVPQNDAWLSAFRNATKSVFIQTPTLNAKPLIPAIVEACERGIDVYCYVCLGYNDSGELLPMQGGHNEMIAAKLYSMLDDIARPRLHYFWYVAKDQTRPIPEEKKQRGCHIKLMIVDDHVGIVGSGNQDTQSWFHSQEVNALIDSEEVCQAWIAGLRRNQNTHTYGALGQDGVWRGPDGKEADGALGVDPGRFSWAKGLIGAVQRARGAGGFG